MRNTSIKAPQIITRLSILLFVGLLSSCGSYAPVSYDNDGIYTPTSQQKRPAVSQTQNNTNQNTTSTVFSQQLNDYSLIGDDNEVFTDVESYSSQEYSSNNQDASFGSRPSWNDSYSDTQANVNINADWGFNNFSPFGPFSYGGFNRFGRFNHFGHFGFGFNNFGGYYNPFFHGPFVRNGFYGGFYNGFYGNGFFFNRSFNNNRFYANRFYNNSRRVYSPRYTNRYSARSSNNRNYTPRRTVNSRSGRINNSNNRRYTPRRATTTNRSGRTNNSSNNRSYTPRRSNSSNSSARTNSSSSRSRTYTPRSSSSNNRSYRSNSSTRSSRSYTPRRSSSSSRSYRRR